MTLLFVAAQLFRYVHKMTCAAVIGAHDV
jgi:hypothetical protein